LVDCCDDKGAAAVRFCAEEIVIAIQK